MAHMIDQMAYVGATPWHGLGNKLSENQSLETWKIDAGLDWTVLPQEVLYRDSKGELRAYQNRRVLVRSDNQAPLSVVSDRYKPVQPEEVLEFFRDFIEQSDFRMETAGSLDYGRKIWALAKAPETLVLPGGDQIGRHLLLATSFDLSIPTIVQQTSIRVVCHNTLSCAVQNGGEKGEASIRRSHKAFFNAVDVKEMMGLAPQWSTFCEAVNLLAEKKMTEKAAEEFLLECFYPEEKRTVENFSERGAKRRVAELVDVMNHAPGSELPSAKGTAWGTVNAVTYFIDHQAKSKDRALRLDKAWFGDGAAMKNRAMELALAFAQQ